MTKDILPPRVRAALEGGNKIEAIKQLREMTGLGLKQAKDWIESYERGEAPSLPPERLTGANMNATINLSKEALEKLRTGNSMEAIKIVRESTGLGLQEASQLVEMVRRELPADGSGLGLLAAARIAAKTSRPADGLAPGEVAGGGGMGKWVILLAIVVVAIGLALYG